MHGCMDGRKHGRTDGPTDGPRAASVRKRRSSSSWSWRASARRARSRRRGRPRRRSSAPSATPPQPRRNPVRGGAERGEIDRCDIAPLRSTPRHNWPGATRSEGAEAAPRDSTWSDAPCGRACRASPPPPAESRPQTRTIAALQPKY